MRPFPSPPLRCRGRVSIFVLFPTQLPFPWGLTNLEHTMKPEQFTRVAGAVLAVALIGALVAPAFAADYRLVALRDLPSVNTTKKNS